MQVSQSGFTHLKPSVDSGKQKAVLKGDGEEFQEKTRANSAQAKARRRPLWVLNLKA